MLYCLEEVKWTGECVFNKVSKWSLPFRYSNQNSECISHVPICATCPTQLILFDLIILILFGEKYEFILPFSPASCLFIPLRSKYSLKHPVLKTLNLCSWLHVRDQVSHSYNATDKIIVLYTLIFTFLHGRWEDKRYWTAWLQPFPGFSLLLIYSGYNFDL
jgi:hypothetical protein